MGLYLSLLAEGTIPNQKSISLRSPKNWYSELIDDPWQLFNTVFFWKTESEKLDDSWDDSLNVPLNNAFS
jgi:hypothetical protein